MADPLCRDVRAYLNALSAGRSSPGPSPEVWGALSAHGAVSGSPDRAVLTDVGRHVLGELEARAGRTDAMSLNALAEMLSRLLVEFDEVVKTAEYFLADLGPVTPPVAVPLLRPVAVGLANRRESPEEIAEEFRNVWGGMEVMGGDPRDRLLAAELLNAASAEMGKVYAPITNTTDRIRQKLGPKVSAATPATLLHLAAGADQPVPLDAYFALRPRCGSDEAAAMLAGLATEPAEALAQRDRFLAGLGGASDATDALHAATYLAAVGADDGAIDRTRRIADALGDRLAERLTPAALLAQHGRLEPAEVVNWLDKAIEILGRRQMAPTPAEITALAVAVVHGLPDSEFLAPSPVGVRPAPAPVSLPALTAIHAWVYRPLLGSPTRVASPAGAG